MLPDARLPGPFFHEFGKMFIDAFDKVDWPNVNWTLHKVPCLFQIWVCKQVMIIPATNKNLS